MKFMCGCDSEQKLANGYQPRFIDGAPVCPEHALPEYGYRTTNAIKQGILVDTRISKDVPG